MASVQDFQLAALAAGFTLGFGFLTVWEAIKQTRRNHSPLRSAYIYMVWGEILVNVCIGIVGWLFLNDAIGPTVPVLFSILFFWVFEIQLLMQIIINRIALIAEHRSTIKKLKWGTFIFITAINIPVFCIWIPSHTNPPLNDTFFKINNIWDKISKVLILIVDAALNWYFLRTVKIRLVNQHGLTKYAPLISFNGKLMIISIAMDALLIGLMFLRNQVVYIQFHPVAYMVKLNIEMSMASLVVRLAQGKSQNDMGPEEFHSTTDPESHSRSAAAAKSLQLTNRSKRNQPSNMRSAGLSKIDSDESLDLGGIQCHTELRITHEDRKDTTDRRDFVESSSRSSNDAAALSVFGDETPLHKKTFRVQEKEV